MSSEYGWTDKEIGDIPLSRLRQITAAIQTRRFHSGREENARFSWLARSLGTVIAAGFEVPKGKPNTAMEYASKLSFDDIETAMLNAPAPEVSKENKPGSYEKLMGSLGGGMKK